MDDALVIYKCWLEEQALAAGRTVEEQAALLENLAWSTHAWRELDRLEVTEGADDEDPD